MHALTRFFVAASILAVAMPAFADEFGQAHVLALSSDANVSFQYISVSPGSTSSTSFLVAPAADIFVADRLSLGGFVMFGSASTSTAMATGSVTTIAIGPRIGYAIDLAHKLSLWPKIGPSFVSVSSNGASDSHVALIATARLLYHPVAHFFVGFGPDLDVDLSGMVRSTTIGVAFTVGGWL